MKKIIAIFLTLVLLTVLAGCKKTNITSSETELLNSFPVLSSVEESIVVPENEVSSINSSSEESKTNTSKVTPNQSNSIISSQQSNSISNTSDTEEKATSAQSSSIISSQQSNSVNNTTNTEQSEKQKPTTWFEKQGFKITPFTEKFCPSNGIGHNCNNELQVTETINDDNPNEKTVMITYSNYQECYGDMSFIAFDRYTGMAIRYYRYFNDEKSYDGFVSELEINGKKIPFSWDSDSFDDVDSKIHIRRMRIFCPTDYDGVVFVLGNYLEWSDNFDSSKLHTIDELIDFSGGKYYFFSASNK